MALALLNLGPTEIAIIAVIAVLVFGRRLPEVAGQAAGAVQRMRRTLADLKRETGIEDELRQARRVIEDAVPRQSWRRTMDAPDRARDELRQAVAEAGAAPPAEAASTDSQAAPHAPPPASSPESTPAPPASAPDAPPPGPRAS